MMIIISASPFGSSCKLLSRTYAFFDSHTLLEGSARDTLFKVGENDFLLHVATEDSSNDRIVWFDSRSALLWINQEEDDYGMNWE